MTYKVHHQGKQLNTYLVQHGLWAFSLFCSSRPTITSESFDTTKQPCALSTASSCPSSPPRSWSWPLPRTSHPCPPRLTQVVPPPPQQQVQQVLVPVLVPVLVLPGHPAIITLIQQSPAPFPLLPPPASPSLPAARPFQPDSPPVPPRLNSPSSPPSAPTR